MKKEAGSSDHGGKSHFTEHDRSHWPIALVLMSHTLLEHKHNSEINEVLDH